MDYRIGEAKDAAALKKLWIECFNDSSRGFRTLWKNLRGIARFYVACDGIRPVACLYHIPCAVSGVQAHYLYGASTQQDYRRRGIMKRLIDFSLDDASSRGDKFSFLFPANDRLYKYYEKVGYFKNCFRKTAEVTREQLMHIAEYGGFCVSMSLNGMDKLRNTQLKGGALKFPREYMKYSISSTKKNGGYIVCGGDGYALISQDKYGECTVSELIAKEEELFPLLGEILSNTQAEKFIFNYPTLYNIFNNEKIVEDGMVKYLSDFKLSEAYIGLRNQ